MPTIAQIIQIGKVSSVLASTDVLNTVLFGRKLDPRLPLMLRIETSTLEMRYLITPTDIQLIGAANYVLELCGNYAAMAQAIIAGGGGGAIITPTAPVGYEYFSEVFIVTATDENVGAITDAPYDGSTVWINPAFIGAKQLSYLIIDNTIETEGYGFTFDDVLGTITSGQRFTGSVISISFMRKKV